MEAIRKRRDKPVNRARRAVARNLPFLRKLYRSIADYFLRRVAIRTLRDLEQAPGVRIGQTVAAIRALNSPETRTHDGWPERIEAIRTELLANDSPLVDGRFPEPGIYDGGRTISACCAVSKPPRAALFLYCLVKALGSRRVLELGTNLGISAAYIAAGMQHHGGGILVTCESSPYRQDIARQTHERLGLSGIDYVLGMFSDTLGQALEVAKEVDLAFIDGHHQYQPTLDYMNQIIPHASPGCVFVFDDIRWSDGMYQAWTEIAADRRFVAVVDLDSVGLCVLGPSDTQRISYGPAKVF